MIKQAVVTTLATPSIWGILRRRALRDRPLTVLCYHTLGPDDGGVDGWTVLRMSDFRAQLDDLRAHYEIVDLHTGLSTESEKPQAVITFDDGDQGLHAYLLPILAETGVPVTVYVATEQIETGQAFWFDRAVNALQGTGEIHLDGLGHWSLPAVSGKARWAILGEILQALKDAPATEREMLTNRIVEQGGAAPEPALGPMRLSQLQELAQTPGVTIGAHTHGHELLDQIPLEAARESMHRSRALLQDWTGQAVDHFAFPNGNHTQALREAARDIGFASAAVLEESTAPRGSDPYRLPRISVGRYDSRNRVRLRLAGL